MNLAGLPRLRSRRTGRASSWDRTGGNEDRILIPPRSSAVLADIRGPAQITHLWLTQYGGYRECLLRITWDDAPFPSVLVPLGDFFGLGHALANSYQSALFTCSTAQPYRFDKPAALNCYAPMPFACRALIELVNEGDTEQLQYFYVDYETLEDLAPSTGYFHAEWRRANPFRGWGPEVEVNTPETNTPNLERTAWDCNYVILETRGRGHYIGCNLSVTNFSGQWWGEGDDMIWVDGYKWPPDLHGTGSEDYFGHGGGMQEDAGLRNGSSLFEGRTVPSPHAELWRGSSGYQTAYVFHLENPVRFEREIKVTIEHGHANHLSNEMSSTAYWYAAEPAPAVPVPALAERLPVLRDNTGKWLRQQLGHSLAHSFIRDGRSDRSSSPLHIIDSHVHFLHPARMDEMLALLEAVPCSAFNLVCLPNRSGAAENDAALAFKARHPGRVYISAALDYRNGIPLDAQVRAFRERGFDGLKLIEGKPEVRKLLPQPLDGPAYAAMWAEVERQGLPVVLHLGDPPEFWDADACPQWARDAGWDYSDGSYPALEALRGELANILARHPRLKLILAHFGFLSHDLDQAAALLDAHATVCFDLAPHIDMYRDFSRRPAGARRFFLTYAGRILYGTDLDTRPLERGPEGSRFMRSIPRLIRSMLEVDGPFVTDGGGEYCGLGLPPDVLAAIYRGNFIALYGSRPNLRGRLAGGDGEDLEGSSNNSSLP